jgi:hypothetical protein
VRAHLSYRLAILNILWWEREAGGGWALGKMVGKEMGEVLDISWNVIGVGQLWVLFFSGSLIRGSYVCIIFVFLDSPAFQAL